MDCARNHSKNPTGQRVVLTVVALLLGCDQGTSSTRSSPASSGSAGAVAQATPTASSVKIEATAVPEPRHHNPHPARSNSDWSHCYRPRCR